MYKEDLYMRSRLKLDFSLETAEERKNFIDTYIVQFPDLTHSEAETIANYLLWGKTKEGVALGAETELETKWSRTKEVDSLESLMENPAQNDLQIKALGDSTPIKQTRKVFNREKVRKNAPPYLIETFEKLWRSIDETDLLINFYELKVGKRTKPPRKELLDRFSEEEQNSIRKKAENLTQFIYLKKRHELIELRREQFTLQDSYQSTINLHQTFLNFHDNSISFEADIQVLPLGLAAGPLKELIFDKNFDPAHLNEQQLQQISDFIWEKKKEKPNSIDFRDLETVYQIYLFRDEFIDQIERSKELHSVDGNLNDLLNTLDFYESIADLTEPQLEILRLKEQHLKNSDIAAQINRKFGKSYTANYISTIFRQKIIVKINEAAELHRETIENCFFPENFKKCTSCGRVLLLDARNWVRKSRSKDGFQNRCKRCEKKARKKV